MAVPLKLILGIGTVGTATVAAPIVITQLPKSSTTGVEKKGEASRDQSTSAPSPTPSSTPVNPARTSLPDSNTKVPCLSRTTFGLKVGEKVVLWAAARTTVDEANKNEHDNKGQVINGKDQICAEGYVEQENS